MTADRAAGRPLRWRGAAPVGHLPLQEDVTLPAPARLSTDVPVHG